MPVLGDDEVRSGLADLPGWSFDGAAIRKQYGFDDFLSAVMVVNRVTGVAEAENHHPDLTVSWGSVGVTLSTHSQGGVTAADLRLAALIEGLS